VRVRSQVLWGECISGALYIEDFKRLAQQVGFMDARVLSSAPIEVTDPELKEVTGEAKFYSITYRSAHSHGSLCLAYLQSRKLSA
jgi:arsenite methyltransferase